MLIMIAGPYRSGSDDPEKWEQNLSFLNMCAVEVAAKGHVPIIGVNAFLPVIEEAGHHSYEQLMMPNCLKLAERCDAVLRIGGPSRGADQEVDVFSARELPVYHSVEDIPVAI